MSCHKVTESVDLCAMSWVMEKPIRGGGWGGTKCDSLSREERMRCDVTWWSMQLLKQQQSVVRTLQWSVSDAMCAAICGMLCAWLWWVWLVAQRSRASCSAAVFHRRILMTGPHYPVHCVRCALLCSRPTHRRPHYALLYTLRSCLYFTAFYVQRLLYAIIAVYAERKR